MWRERRISLVRLKRPDAVAQNRGQNRRNHRTRRICLYGSATSLTAQYAASSLGYFGDNLAGKSLNLGVCHRFLARLDCHRNCYRFLAWVDAFTFIHIEDNDVADQLLVRVLRRAHDVGGLDRIVDDESKIALDRLERRHIKQRLCPRRARFGLGDFFENHFEGDQGALGLQAGNRARMQFTEVSQDILRANLDGAATSGVKPGRTARHDLQSLHRRTSGSEHGESVGFYVENIGGSGLVRPVAAASRRLGEAAAQPAGGRELVGGLIAFEDLANFEHCGVGEPAVGIALRCHDQAGNKARPHVGQLGGDRIRKCKLLCAATKQLGFSLRYERPCHGFKQSARRKRSLCFARTILNRSENGLAGLLSPETGRWYTVHADNTHELLDNIGTTGNVWSPGWHGDFHALALAGAEKAEFFQDTPQVRKR